MSNIPPISDLDIYRAAHAVLKQHGENAWEHAVARAQTFNANGDVGGRDVWVRIANALREEVVLSNSLPSRGSAPGDTNLLAVQTPAERAMSIQKHDLIGKVGSGYLYLPPTVYPDQDWLVLTRSVFVGMWRTYVLTPDALTSIVATVDESWFERAAPEAPETSDLILIRTLFHSDELRVMPVVNRRVRIPPQYREGLRSGKVVFSTRDQYAAVTRAQRTSHRTVGTGASRTTLKKPQPN